MANEDQVEQIDGSGTLEAITRGEIDTQIRTAKAYPRSIKKFINEATDMACLDEATAESCIYALPRAGKTIEGPSARLAEIVASAWGNCRAGARVVAEENNFVVAQGVFLDLERNVAITFETKRRITDRNGRRFSDDMIVVTSNAACSIALRNAVFKGVPKAFWGSIYDAAKKTAIGDTKSLATKRNEMVNYFGKMGVGLEQILAAVGQRSLEDIGAEEIAVLKGTASAIKEGEITVDEAFPRERTSKPDAQNAASATSGGAADALKADLNKKRQAKQATPESPAEPEAPETASPADDNASDEGTDENEEMEEAAPSASERPALDPDSEDAKREFLEQLFNEYSDQGGKGKRSRLAADALERIAKTRRVTSTRPTGEQLDVAIAHFEKVTGRASTATAKS